jgi:CRP/FNR family cyclic AMP-dependent transcriptional regulator
MDSANLITTGALSNVADEDRAALAEVMRIEDRPRGNVLVEEGDIPDKFFLLVNGHVTVHRSGRHVADLGPGDIFGETGVLALKPRNASVIATTPVQVAVAMGWDVRGLLPERPSLKAALEAEAEQRDSTD